MIRQIFLNHPASVDESYWQHMRFAFGFAAQLMMAAAAALVHATVPCLFEKTASRIIQRLYEKTCNRG